MSWTISDKNGNPTRYAEVGAAVGFFVPFLFLGLQVRGAHVGFSVFFDLGQRGLRDTGQVGFSLNWQVGTAGSTEVVGDGVESVEGDGVEPVSVGDGV